MHDDPFVDPATYEPQEVRVARAVGELRAALGDLCDGPPWPAREILTAFRLKSGMGNHPKSCPKPACRRARLCRATDIEAGASCSHGWTYLEERDFQAMALGVLIAWRAQSVRASAEAAVVARWSGPGTGGAPLSGAKRSRKRKR